MSQPSSSSSDKSRPQRVSQPHKASRVVKETSTIFCYGILQYDSKPIKDDNGHEEPPCPVCHGIEIEFIKRTMENATTKNLLPPTSPKPHGNTNSKQHHKNDPKGFTLKQGGILFFGVTYYDKNLVTRTPDIMPSQFHNIFPALVYTEKTVQESLNEDLKQIPDRLVAQLTQLPDQLRDLTKEGKSGLLVAYKLGKAELSSLPSNAYRGSQILVENAVAGVKAIYKFIRDNEPKS